MEQAEVTPVVNQHFRCCRKCGTEYSTHRSYLKLERICPTCRNVRSRASWLKKQLERGKQPWRFDNLLKQGKKKCTGCKEIKSVDQFNKKPDIRHGLRARCRECESNDENGRMKDSPINLAIWHFTNLQPLWHEENARKGNKYTPGGAK